MKCQIPQISWHGRTPVLSVDFQFVENNLRRLATGGTDAHVVIWYVTLCPKSTVDVECACDLSRHNKSVNVVRFSPNGEYLASGDDEGAVFIWKLREKTAPPDLDYDESKEEGNKEDWCPFKLLRGHLDDISDINWSPNGEFLISGSIDNSAIIWDIQKGQNVRILKEAKSFIQGVVWDPLNQFQATISSDRMLRIYNASSGKITNRIHRLPWVDSAEKTSGKANKLFHDDTLKSFCRRLTFSPDGELLFVPSGIREKGDQLVHTTYVFSRYEFITPILHLPTGQKYTLAVRCCPVLYKLKGNPETITKTIINLPYRIIIAVATQDSIFFYDTQQILPFGYVSNIHYTHLTDISWSSDGRMLIISSTDGYCSFIIFTEGELGEVYVPEKLVAPAVIKQSLVESNKTEKVNALSPVRKNTNESATEISTPEDSSKSPHLNKCRTPKRTPTSTKKVRTIENFFSPPGKAKSKRDEVSDECTIIKEIIHKNAKIAKCEEPAMTLLKEEEIEPMDIEENKDNDKKEIDKNSSDKDIVADVEIILDLLKLKVEKMNMQKTMNNFFKKKENESGELKKTNTVSVLDNDSKSINVKSLTSSDNKNKITNWCTPKTKNDLSASPSTSSLPVNSPSPSGENPKPKKRVAFTTISTKISTSKN